MRKLTHQMTIKVFESGDYWVSKTGIPYHKDETSIFKDAIIEELFHEIEVGDWVLVYGWSGPYKVAAVSRLSITYHDGDALESVDREDCTLTTPPEGEA